MISVPLKPTSLQISKEYAEVFPIAPRAHFYRWTEQALAFVALVVLSPLFGLIALLIKIDSKGPIFYSQIRAGKNRRKIISGPIPAMGRFPSNISIAVRQKNLFGRPLRIWKFRTMRPDAEINGKPVWCIENDPRVTRVGSILRATHLDELPQLWNIFTGEMSIVGPRPERPEIIEDLCRLVPGYERRLLVRPGVTGLAQIRHRADIHLSDVRKKIKYDLFYLRHRSISTDLKIILETVPISMGFSISAIRKIRRKSPLLKTLKKAFKPKKKTPQFFSNLFSEN